MRQAANDPEAVVLAAVAQTFQTLDVDEKELLGLHIKFLQHAIAGKSVARIIKQGIVEPGSSQAANTQIDHLRPALQLHRLHILAEQQHKLGRLTVATGKEQAKLADRQLREVNAGADKIEGQSGRRTHFGTQAGILQKQRNRFDILGRAKNAGRTIDGQRTQFGSGRNHHRFHLRPARRKCDHAGRRNGAQKMREQEIGDFLNEFGELIVEFLPRHPREKSHALKQALDIRVGRHAGKHRCQRRIGFGKLRRQRTELDEFVFVITIQHALQPRRNPESKALRQS